MGTAAAPAVQCQVPSLAVLGGTVPWVQIPIQSRSTVGPPSERPKAATSTFSPSVGPQFGRQFNSPGHSLDQPGWGANFCAACLIAAQRIFIRVVSSTSTATNSLISVTIQRFCGVSALLCYICNAALLLQESISLEASIVSALCVAVRLHGT